MRTHTPDDELVRARLALMSVGQRPLNAPRRAADPLPDDSQEAWAVPDAEPELVPPVHHDDGAAPVPTPTWTQRLRLSRTQMAALAVVLLAAVVVLGMSMLQSSATEVPAQPLASVPQEQPPAEAEEPSSSPSPAPVPLRVHVLGGVERPGVVTVEEGAIVADAIEAAGGLSDDAVPGDLNFAAPVAPGMQIKVGTEGDESRVEGAPAAPAGTDGGAAPAAGGDGRLDLNAATAAQLEELPGVGPVTAAAIVAWREEHGSFSSTSELQEVSGIGPKTFAKLEPLVRV